MVLVEALREAEGLGEVRVRDERARRIAVALEGLGDRLDLARQRGRLRHRLMTARQERGEQRGGRRLRPRSVGEAVEDRAAIGRNSAQVRGRDELPAVTREVVCAQRVDHHEDHVRAARERGGRSGWCAGRSGARELARGEVAAAGNENEQRDRERRAEEFSRGAAKDPRPHEEEQQREQAEAAEQRGEHRQRRHLFEVHVAAQAEDRNCQAHGHERSEQRERGRPAARFRFVHRKRREHHAAERAQRAEERGVGERPVPEHLRLGAEALLRDRDGFARGEQQAGDHARAEAVSRADLRARSEWRRGSRSSARCGVLRAVLRGFERSGGARSLGVIHLHAVHEAPGRCVRRGPNPPEDAAEQSQPFSRPEAERRRSHRRARADHVLEHEQLRELADAFARDCYGREHRREDLHGRAEHHRPELRADGADRERGEVVHRGGREVHDERECERL